MRRLDENTHSQGFHRHPCTSKARSQFQLEDCFLPKRNPNVLLSASSFLLSHNAATGYLNGITTSYAKNQQGNIYEQLNDGARAIDARPKLLQNGSLIFHHGIIDIQKNYQDALLEAIQWCKHNPQEIVLWLTSHYAYESQATASDMMQALNDVHDALGVTYVSCDDTYQWTIQNVMENAVLTTGGYLLAIYSQDGANCVKDNWVESKLVTCWNRNQTSCKISNQPFLQLQDYILASANNAPTDDPYTLGPSSSLPLWQIQALWQVTTRSAAMGMAHASSILQDNEQSHINEKVLRMLYYDNDQFTSGISLLAVDNVHRHGNALSSVLRTQCGQSTLDRCGRQIDFPALRYFHITSRAFWITIAILYGLYGCVWYILGRRRRWSSAGRPSSQLPTPLHSGILL